MKFKELKLSDIASIKNGKKPTKKLEKGKYELFGSNGVIGYTTKSNSDRNSIIIGRVGANAGSVLYSAKKYWASDNSITVTANNYIDSYYLFYLLKSIKINRFVSGSAQPLINQSILNSFSLNLVDSKDQKSIGNFLRNMDSKIEINNQIISTLEELASTLYKRWFVDFEFPDENGNSYKSSGGKMVDTELGEIPEGWEVKRLGDFSTIVMGQSPKGESYNYDKIGTPLVNGASDFKNGIVTPLKYTTEPKKVTKKGDYIFGVRATVGNVTETHLEYAIGRGAGIARSKGIVGKEFLYFNLINIINYLESTASGSVYINISRKDLDDFKVVYPSEKVLGLFHDTTLYMLTEKQNKYKENILLQESRDSLLPKLLSGEIEIPQSEDV